MDSYDAYAVLWYGTFNTVDPHTTPVCARGQVGGRALQCTDREALLAVVLTSAC